MTDVPKVCETLARRLITVKANQRKLTSEMVKLFGDIQCFAADETVIKCTAAKGNKMYQIGTASYRSDVAAAVSKHERSHAILCGLHSELKWLCDEADIPIPPDPDPDAEDGGR